MIHSQNPVGVLVDKTTQKSGIELACGLSRLSQFLLLLESGQFDRNVFCVRQMQNVSGSIVNMRMDNIWFDNTQEEVTESPPKSKAKFAKMNIST